MTTVDEVQEIEDAALQEPIAKRLQMVRQASQSRLEERLDEVREGLRLTRLNDGLMRDVTFGRTDWVSGGAEALLRTIDENYQTAAFLFLMAGQREQAGACLRQAKQVRPRWEALRAERLAGDTPAK